MDAMGDVLKKTDAEEKAFEARILRDQIRRDELLAKQDRDKADAKLKREQNLLKELEMQVKTREEIQKKEFLDNQKYVKMVIDQDNRDNKNDKLAQ